jgi:hypothetical protein
MSLKILAVGGNFGDKPSASGYIKKLFSSLDSYLKVTTSLNGGSYQELFDLQHTFKDYDVILWFPNISNSFPKIVKHIKKQNHKALLVISKNNRRKEYSYMKLIARALKVKANLMIEFQDNDARIIATILDPLGNGFLNKSLDIDEVARVLAERILKLKTYTRIKSSSIGKALEIPNKLEFFEICKKYAKRFHELIHSTNSERFLGNLSFRCERGFPSFKKDEYIYVSKRNIDKKFINQKGFVAVEPTSLWNVFYYGDHKPSVDTPIQLMIYKWFPNIKYLLHSHVYIKNTEFTRSVIPCGSIEEFHEIVNMGIPQDANNFKLNLNGHGCLIGSNNIDYLKDLEFSTRPIPDFYSTLREKSNESD